MLLGVLDAFAVITRSCTCHVGAPEAYVRLVDMCVLLISNHGLIKLRGKNKYRARVSTSRVEIDPNVIFSLL